MLMVVFISENHHEHLLMFAKTKWNYCEDQKHKGIIFITPKQAFDELKPGFEGATTGSFNMDTYASIVLPIENSRLYAGK